MTADYKTAREQEVTTQVPPATMTITIGQQTMPWTAGPQAQARVSTPVPAVSTPAQAVPTPEVIPEVAATGNLSLCL